jgi:hypothetical protein
MEFFFDKAADIFVQVFSRIRKSRKDKDFLVAGIKGMVDLVFDYLQQLI